MRATPVLVALLTTATAFAGCLSAQESGSFSARPAVADSAAVFTIDRGAGLAYADLLVLADDKPFRFGPRADWTQGWFQVDGKDRAEAQVEIGDEIRIPLAGQVQIEFRRASDGASLQQSTLDVPDHTPPAAPTPTAPAQNARDVQRETHFEWASVADVSGVTYQVEYWIKVGGQGDAPPRTVTGLAGSSYSVPPSDRLLPGQTYQWHVRAVDGAGNVGSWSPVREFTTGL